MPRPIGARLAMNPVLNDVAGAFNRVATHPQSISIDRAGVVLPEGGHFQSIQRLASAPQRVVITSSSNSQAYFVMCDMNSNVSGHVIPLSMDIGDCPWADMGTARRWPIRTAQWRTRICP